MNRSHIQRYVSLTTAFAWADFKLRFHGSSLGLLWYIIRPLIIFSVTFIVFSFFIHITVTHYAAKLLLGIVLWNFFYEATIFSLDSLERKAGLIKKIAFPRTIIVISAILTALYTFCFNLSIFFLLAFSTLHLTPVAFLSVLYVIPHFVFTIGVSFIICALYARFRDVRPLWEVSLQVGNWITPVIYTAAVIPAAYQPYIFINPLARTIEYARAALIDGVGIGYSSVIGLYIITGAVLWAGYILFQSRSKKFAEEL